MKGKSLIRYLLIMSEKNLLVGYPRSGNNWVRYIIEAISPYQTGVDEQISKTMPTLRMGQGNDTGARRNPFWLSCNHLPQKAYNSSPWFLHTHLSGKTGDIPAVALLHQGKVKMVAVIRDPVECLIRDSTHSIDTIPAVRGNHVHHLFELLAKINLYSGPKIILYYEDLIDKNKIKDSISNLATFLEVPQTCVDDFISDYDLHVKSSKALYGHQFSDGSRDFHKKKHRNVASTVKNYVIQKKKMLQDLSIIERYGY